MQLLWNRNMHYKATASHLLSTPHTPTLTPHEAVVDKFLIDVEVGRSACAGLFPANVMRDLGHLKAGLLQQAEDTGGSLTLKRHLKVSPVKNRHMKNTDTCHCLDKLC